MPIYDYRCQSCQATTAVRHSLAEEPHLICAECGSDAMTRIISRVSVVMSNQDRTRDLSWVDRNLASRLRKQISGRLTPPLGETLDRMEKS